MSAPRRITTASHVLLAALFVTACSADPEPGQDAQLPDVPGEDTGDAGDAAPPDASADTDVADSGSRDGGGETDIEALDTRFDSEVADTHDDLAANECPVARAACTVAGSGTPLATEVFSVPLDTVECRATGSEDLDGDIVEYVWAVVERPDGSTSQFDPNDKEATTFFVDLAGRYVLSLEVVDARGCASEPSLVTLVARPDADIHVELVWTTPDDPRSNDYGFGAGTDVDLHFLHPSGCWEDVLWDCHFRSREPNWGTAASDDDPLLAIDDTDGWGPEVVNLDSPENGAAYRVGVHYYNDHGYGVSFATVRIYVFGELLYEARDKELSETGVWWEVAALHFPTAEITPVDLGYDSVPPCP